MYRKPTNKCNVVVTAELHNFEDELKDIYRCCNGKIWKCDKNDNRSGGDSGTHYCKGCSCSCRLVKELEKYTFFLCPKFIKWSKLITLIIIAFFIYITYSYLPYKHYLSEISEKVGLPNFSWEWIGHFFNMFDAVFNSVF